MAARSLPDRDRRPPPRGCRGRGVGVRLLDAGRRRRRAHRVPAAPHGCAGVVLVGGRAPRRAVAARHRVGRAGAQRPAARQGARAVGRARLRRADGAVDGLQRDVCGSARRSGRRARSRLRPADAGRRRSGVVRHGGAAVDGGRVRPGRRRPRRGRARRRPAPPDRGPGSALAPVGRLAGSARAGRRLRPHGLARAVRVPRRRGRRLGAHPGRLAVTGPCRLSR